MSDPKWPEAYADAIIAVLSDDDGILPLTVRMLDVRALVIQGLRTGEERGLRAALGEAYWHGGDKESNAAIKVREAVRNRIRALITEAEKP